MTNKKLIWAISLNLSVFIISVLGLFIDGTSAVKFLYFTILSNIFIAIICGVFAILQLLIMKNKISFIPNWLYIIKFICTVGITLTCIVYNTMLLPQSIVLGATGYLLQVSNWFLHLISPVCAIVSFLVFDYKLNTNRYTFLYSTVLPMAYFIFSMILSVVLTEPIFIGFGEGKSFFPYFFLNYKENGWFNVSEGVFKLGVFYWFVIICAFVLLVGYLYIKLLNRAKNKQDNFTKQIIKHNK